MIGEGPGGFEFYERHFVNGRRRRLGGDLAFTPGPIGIKAEYLEGREERQGQGSTFDDLPEQVARGWAGSLTWLVTGESKKGRIEPKRPFPHGIGAVEIGGRYEELRFDDAGPDEGFAGAGNRARNIRPAADRVIAGGLSWWPVHWVRLMGNVVVERYRDPLLAPEPGRRGNYVTLLGRAQVALP
jgi:phosphate-selective porin